MTTVYSEVIEQVARLLVGDPNTALSKPDDLRFRTHGSLSIKPSTGQWHDHEANIGGGVLDLVCHLDGADSRASAHAWLVSQGLVQDAPKQTAGSTETAYQYVSADGEVLFEVVRKPGKEFRQRRQEGGKWVWNLQGVQRVLYRLPELLAAPPETVIFVAEGEKDVDRLRSHGLVATCNSGGAGRWRKEYSEALRGRHVVILPDNDTPGRDHAEQVRKALSGIAATVTVLALPDLPEKGDVSDWLDAGNTADDLVALSSTLPAVPVGAADGWRADVVCADSIVPQPITWLWPTWLAAGKLTILAGAAGTGKTTLCLGFIATLSCAGRWPDGERCLQAGNTIIWSSEDDPGDTLVPRLMAMGADLSRIHFVQGRIDDRGNREPFDPAVDMDLLRETARRIGGVSLLMLDPVVSAVKGDMNKANEVRRSLQAVVDFAVEHNAAIVGITHFAKGTQGTTPQERVIGSQAFGALARMVLGAAKPEDSDMRVLARLKSNITVDDGGISYGIEAATLDNGIETTRVYWGEKVEGSAREILGDVENHGGESTEREDAEQFLCDLLKDGPLPSKQVYEDANGAGFTRATIRRAQKEIGIKPYKDGEGIGEKSAWYWCLPPAAGFTKMLTETPKMLTPKAEHLSENVSTLVEIEPFRNGPVEVI